MDKKMPKSRVEQKKIAFPTAIYNEVKLYSEATGIPMARVLARLWQSFKNSKEYAMGVLQIPTTEKGN